jgi:hypothetical protein
VTASVTVEASAEVRYVRAERREECRVADEPAEHVQRARALVVDGARVLERVRGVGDDRGREAAAVEAVVVGRRESGSRREARDADHGRARQEPDRGIDVEGNVVRQDVDP